MTCPGPRTVFLSLLTFAMVLPSLVVSGEEPFGVRLLRPDSLAGWDYDSRPPSGWTVAEGRLAGTEDSTPLLSGFTAGDGELRLAWSVADGGVWKIAFPEVPQGEGLSLWLNEGDGCGALTDGGKPLAAGAKVESRGGAMHAASIRRADGKLTLTVDGKQLHQVDVDARRRFGLRLAIVKGKGVLADLRGVEPPGQPVFNGKNLDGWWTDGNKDAWVPDDGELVLKPGGGRYLRSEKEYANFTLSVEYQMAKGGNSGIGIRTPRRGWPSGDGMEVQFIDGPPFRPLDEHDQMAIYGNVPALAPSGKVDPWNHVVIKADGWMISAWVDGELIQQYNTLDHPELKHRHLRGWIGPQDHGAQIRFRNFRVLESPDGTGLAAWSKPKPALAATTMVDRLMNSEAVSRDDGITSAVVSKTIAENAPGEHVLAELTGPGAVVRVARNSDEGALAFFFDGEASPRIECEPADLRKEVPPLNEDPAPVLTYLAYRKSLRMVLRGAKQAEYRIDYVTFPEGMAVTTFDGRITSIPRGWLSAPLYRQHVIHWGVHREFDPAPRLRGEAKTIAPGKTEALAHFDGAGLIRWVKLWADPGAAADGGDWWQSLVGGDKPAVAGLLAGNDLWLEATIDGEPRPALSAPARFWFPGFVDGGNFNNYVLVDRNGVANLLAMPFARGITVSATNRGSRPISGVGVELSVEPATDQTRADIINRPRLRGVFQPGGEGTDEFFRQEGAGRWVGLVLGTSEAPTPGVAELLVDGQPAGGWAAASLDGFLGQSGRDFRRCLSGNRNGLAWRYLLMAPVDFHQSLVLKSTAKTLPDRLALFYVKP